MPPRAKTCAVSLADVAAAAGVSAQTVSRVAHNAHTVRPETADRVRAAMAELGYRPSFAGRSLKAGRYHAVGLALFGDLTDTGNVYRVDSIAQAATAAGYALTFIALGPGEGATLASCAARMSALPVDGLIFNLSRWVDDFHEFAPLPCLPTVILTMLEHHACSTVENDQRGCSRTVVEHLLERGHRTVHHVAGRAESMASQQREAGWRRALEERGIEAPEVLRGDWTGLSGYEAGRRLAETDGCTAVYASNDAMALGVIEAFRDAGRRVPEDVSVVGVDNSLDAVLPKNTVTSVSFDNRAVGRWAFEKAMGLDGAAGRRERRLIPGTLVERGSTGPR